MAEFPINFDYYINLVLSAFMRSDSGTAEYEKGLSPLRCIGIVNVTLLSLGDMANRRIEQELTGQIGDHFGSIIAATSRRLNNAVLVDNDDAFFRNMVPSHLWATFMAMFSEDNPLMFTPDVSPPPIRLHMPMLVGHNQTNLMADLRRYLAAELERQFANVRFEVSGQVHQPNTHVVIPATNWDVTYITP